MLSGIVVRLKMGALVHTRTFPALLITFVLLLGQSPMVFAHGGEDHGDKKPVAPSAAGQMNSKLATTEGYEVFVKYPTPKPAEEIPLRVFITDSKTNGPIAGVNVAMVFSYAGKTEAASAPSYGIVHADTNSVEATATPTDTPGVYEARVVFPEVGQYNIALRLAGADIKRELTIAGIVVPANATNAGSNGARGIPSTFLILFVIFLISAAAAAYLFWLQRRRRLPHSDVVAASTYTEAREHEA